MSSELLISISGIAVVTLGASLMLLFRAQHYERLASILAGTLSTLDDCGHAVNAGSPPDFSDGLATISDFIKPALLHRLRAEVLELAGVERSFVPMHKSGGTIAYATIIEQAPALAQFYHSKALANVISEVVGAQVKPTPLQDQSSLSVLIYDKPGDHIGWHYEHNFYRGRHFTVLLPIVNVGRGNGGLSHGRFQAKIGGVEKLIPTPPGSLLVFEGARVLHRALPISEGERRIVVSMTYCTDSAASLAQGAMRRVKDTAFFGLRALWT